LENNNAGKIEQPKVNEEEHTRLPEYDRDQRLASLSSEISLLRAYVK